MLEWVNCNLCNSNTAKLLYTKDSLNVVRCQKCGLVYTNPRLNNEDRKKHYSKGYFNSYFRDKKIHLAKRFLKRIREINRYKKPGCLLDIGCGPGFFLKEMKKIGWNVYGTDLSPEITKYASSKFGLEVISGEFNSFNYPEENFDVVTLWHILEHEPNPRLFLEKVYRVLKKEGILAIEVPNINSIVVKIINENWELLAPKEHLYYFSPKTLTKLLNQTGYKIVKFQTYFWTSPDVVLSYICKKSLPSLVNKILFIVFSWIRFRTLPKFINIGDVMVVYARK